MIGRRVTGAAGLLLFVWGCATAQQLEEKSDELALAHRRITNIAAGPEGTTCFLKWGGTVTCTAADWLKESKLPWLAHDIAVAKGAVCVIKKNLANPTDIRSVVCTGDSQVASAGNKLPVKRYDQIQAGTHFVATRQKDGTVRFACKESSCFIEGAVEKSLGGFYGFSLKTISAKHIGALGSVFCMIGKKGKVDGRIVCVSDQSEQLPSFSNLSALGRQHGRWIASPQKIPAGGNFEKVHVGPTHACAVDKSQRIRCWGDDENDPQLKQMLQQVNSEAADTKYQAVVVGWRSTCAKAKKGGAVRCWGVEIGVQPPLSLITMMTE